MGPRKSGLFLVKSPARDMSKERIYRTGELIPASGIYRVVHLEHRLPHEVTLLKDEQFPRCAKCASAVTFELLQAAQMERDVFRHNSVRICVYELPEMEHGNDDKQMAI